MEQGAYSTRAERQTEAYGGGITCVFDENVYLLYGYGIWILNIDIPSC